MTVTPRTRVVRYEQSRQASIGRPRDRVPGEGMMDSFRRALAGVPVAEEHKWKRVGVRVPPEWWKDIDTLAQRSYPSSSRAAVLRAALWQYLNEQLPEVVAWDDEDIRELERIEKLRNTKGRTLDERKPYRAKADQLEDKLAEKLQQKEAS